LFTTTNIVRRDGLTVETLEGKKEGGVKVLNGLNIRTQRMFQGDITINYITLTKIKLVMKQ
jgi:hypothetical protein